MPKTQGGFWGYPSGEKALCAHRLLRGVSHAEEYDPMAELLHDGCETPAPEWQKCLVHGAAKLAGGWTRAGRRSVYVTGRKVDCEIVVYVTTYLIREIQRLAGERYGERNLRESFGFGAMQTVLETLRAVRASWNAEHPSMQDIESQEDGALHEYWTRNHGQTPSEANVDSTRYDGAPTAKGARSATG